MSMDRNQIDGVGFNRDLEPVTRGASAAARPQKLAIQIRGLTRISSNSEFDSFYSRDDLSTSKLNHEARNAESQIKTDVAVTQPVVKVVDLNQDYADKVAAAVQATAPGSKPKKQVGFVANGRPRGDRRPQSSAQKRSTTATPIAYEKVLPFRVERQPYQLPAAFVEPPTVSSLTNIHFSGLHSRRPARSPEVQLRSATRMNVVIQSIDQLEQRHSEVADKLKGSNAKRDRETFNQLIRQNEVKKQAYRRFEEVKTQGRAPTDVLRDIAKARSYTPVKRGNVIQSPESSTRGGAATRPGHQGHGRWNVSEEVRYQLRHEKKSKKLEEADFNYVFFEANLRDKLMPKIDRINKERADEQIQRKLRQGFADLTSTFVMAQLSKSIDKDGQFSRVEARSLAHNKLTWSKMFMKQHKIQRLLVEYFEKINAYVVNEVNQNGTQLRDFLRFPRALRQYRGKQPVDVPEESKLATRELLSLSSGDLSKLEDREPTFQSTAQKPVTRTDSKEATLTQTLKAASTVRKPQKTGLQSKKTWTSASDDLPKFINELPDALKAKNAEMIERVLKLFKTDKEFSEAFKKIVRNNKLMFTEKLERLGALNDEYEQRECDEKHRNDIRESLARIEDQLVDIENDRKDMEIHFVNLEDQSQRRKLETKRPGEKLLDRLGAWFAELESYQQDPIDQRLFASKLWRVAEDFEEELRQEEKGHHILMKRMKAQHEEREKELKEKYSFRIEALERALNELKTSSQRQIDRAQMEINEMQSFQMNLALDGKFKETADFLRHELEQYAEKGIVEESEQEKIKKLLMRNIRAGMQQRANQSDLMKRRAENRPLNEFLLSKLRQYVKMMEVQKLREYTLADQIKQYQVKGAQIAELHDEMHHKCVLYQDLFHAMLTLLSDALVKLRCLSSADKDELLENCKLDEARLTLDTEQIEKVRQQLIGLSIEDNLTEFTDKLGDTVNQVGTIKQLMSKSTLIEWMQSAQREPVLPRDEEVVSSCGEEAQEKSDPELARLVNRLFSSIRNLVEHFDFQVPEAEPKEGEEGPKKDDGEAVAVATAEFVKGLGKEAQASDASLRKLDKIGQANTKKDKKGAKKEAQAKEKKQTGKAIAAKAKAAAPDQKQGQESNKQQTKGVPLLHAGRKRDTLRLGIFDETVEYLVKSLSKKKIHYQMDQLSQREVTRHVLYNFHEQIRIDPICSLLLRATDKKKEGALSSSQTMHSLSCSVSEHEVEERITSVDDVIKKVNENIQQLYQQIQLKQPNSGHSTAPAFARQKILPIDCVRIEAFEAPQFNVMPFKLLLLKRETNLALSLFSETLKIVSNFLDVSHLEIDNESIRRLDIRRRLVKQAGAQCDLASGDDGTSKYERLQAHLIDCLDGLMIQLDRDKMKDKAFIDQEIDESVFRLLKTSLIMCNSEKDFLADVSAKVLTRIQKARSDCNDAHEEQIEKLKEQLEKAEQDLREQKVQFEQLENQHKTMEFQQSRARSASKRKGSAKRAGSKPLSKTQTIKQLKNSRASIKLDQLKKDEGTLDIERQSESVNINISSSRKKEEDKKWIQSQGTPADESMRLYRAPELIQRGYQQFTNSVLQEMDQYAKKENLDRQSKKQQEDVLSQRSKNRSGNDDVVLSAQINKRDRRQESVIFMTQNLKQTRSESTMSLVGASASRGHSPAAQHSPDVLKSLLDHNLNNDNQKLQAEKCVETEVTMNDMQLILQYKERSTKKIISLEDEIKQLKKQSNRDRLDFMMERQALKGRSSTTRGTTLSNRNRMMSSFDYYKSIQANQLRKEVPKPMHAVNQHQSNVQKLLSAMESSFAEPGPYASNHVVEVPVAEDQNRLQYLVSHMPELILIGSRNLYHRKLLKGSTLYVDKLYTENSSIDGAGNPRRPSSALQHFIRSRQGSIQFNQTSRNVDLQDKDLKQQASKFFIQPGANVTNGREMQPTSQQFLSNESYKQQKPIEVVSSSKDQPLLSQDWTPQESTFNEEKEFNINEKASQLKTRHRIRRKQQNQIQQKIGYRRRNGNLIPSQFKSYTNQGSRAQSQLQVDDSSQQIDNMIPSVAFNANGPMESRNNTNQSQVLNDKEGQDEQLPKSNQQASYNIIESIDDELINIGSLNEVDKKTGNLMSASNEYDGVLSQNVNESHFPQSSQDNKMNDTFLRSQDRSHQQMRKTNKIILSNRSQRHLVKSTSNGPDSFIIPFNYADQEGKKVPKKSTTRSIQEEADPMSRMTPTNQYTDVADDLRQQEQANQGYPPHEVVQADNYLEAHIDTQQNQVMVQHRQPPLNRINERPKTSNNLQRKKCRDETSLIARNIKNNIMEDFQNLESKALEKYRRSFNKVQRIESSKNPQSSAMMQVRHRSGKESFTGSINLVTTASRLIHVNQSSVSNFDIDTQHHHLRNESDRGQQMNRQQAYLKFQQKASVTPGISQSNLLKSNKNSRILHKRRTETAQSIDQTKLQKMMEFKNSMRHIRYKSSQRNTSANESSTKSIFYNRTSLHNPKITSTQQISKIQI